MNNEKIRVIMTTKELIKYGVETGQYPKYIYKYMPNNKNTRSALKNHYLWFSNFSKLNDPYEGKIRISKNYTQDDLNAFLVSRQSEWDASNIKQFMMNPTLMIDKLIMETRKDLKVCCFSSDCQNLLMWSHYASNHKGICLQFDITEEDSELFRYLQPIHYTNVNECCNYIKNANSYIKRLVYTKSLDWSYEKEYRTSFPCHIGNKISYSVRTLKSVIFGCRTEDVFRKQIIASLPSTIEYKKCELNDYEFKIDIKNL